MLAGLSGTLLLQQLGQVAMTMRGERTHTELIGQGQGLPVVALRRFDFAWIATRKDFTEQTLTPCLVTLFTLAPSESQALVSLA